VKTTTRETMGWFFSSVLTTSVPTYSQNWVGMDSNIILLVGYHAFSLVMVLFNVMVHRIYG